MIIYFNPIVTWLWPTWLSVVCSSSGVMVLIILIIAIMVKVVLVITSDHCIILCNELALHQTQRSYTEKNHKLLLESCISRWECHFKVTWLWPTWLSVVCGGSGSSVMVEIIPIIATMLKVVWSSLVTIVGGYHFVP